jgi:diguanylate cyclase (GGDEF)-like protein
MASAVAALAGHRVVLVVLAGLATLLTFALLARLLRVLPTHEEPAPHSERRSRFTPADVRQNPAEALALVGDALAATHNPRALLPVILEVLTEATGATGGRVLDGGSEIAWTGDVSDAESGLVFDLAPGTEHNTKLTLFPPHSGFAPETRQLADWLSSQAAIALENARLHHVVQHQAVTDELTGLVNRRRFVGALGSEFVRARAFGTPLSIVMADLDHFKLVNDRFGHAAGDEVLQRFAELIRAHLRDVDVPGRLGGEEFAILVPETDASGAAVVAERVRSAFGSTQFLLAHPHTVTATFGVAQLQEDESAGDLLQRADRALYRGKGQGRNRVVVDAGVTPSPRA